MMNTQPDRLLSFAVEISYATRDAQARKAAFTVNATGYEQAYELTADHVRRVQKPSRIFGGRLIGIPLPTNAKQPGVDVGREG